MTITVVVDENMPAVEDYLDPSVVVRRLPGRQLTAEDVAAADALLVRSVTRVDQRLLAGSQVRFVGSATSGFDHIDRNYLAACSIPFSYAPGANANSVVEYVLAAIGAIDDYLERLLAGGRVGVVGYGHVGKALVARLQALGVDYRVSDPWLEETEVPNVATLAEVLACDVISLHPELTREQPWPSYHLLAERELAQLQSGQLLVNASRGPVINNTALLRRLQAGNAPAVVLDVWENEPSFDTELLAQVEIGTAHIAGYSLDSKCLASAMVCRELSRHFRLQQPAGDSADRNATLQPDPGVEGAAQLLRHLLAQCYVIADDDRLLRSLRGDVATGFDQLRRHYRERRELAGSLVDENGLDGAARSLVNALGCEPVQGKRGADDG